MNFKEITFDQVSINDKVWAHRIKTNRDVTLPLEEKACRDTGRLDVWAWKKGMPNTPHIFWDSDVAKWIEAAACALSDKRDAKLERTIDRYVDALVAAQGNDGYANSHFLRVEPEKRWSNIRDWHELYCAGHLMEAAVAYFKATGKRKLLDAMCRYGDLICKTFGKGNGQIPAYPGHEEIELALVKMYRATGDRKYLDQAKYFIDERGREPNYFIEEAKRQGQEFDPIYNQAHIPVRKQTVAVGHAVRAMYLYCGMADVAKETNDKSLVRAMKTIWKNTIHKRMHVTGGIGQTAQGEAFSFDYDLPNEFAYDETCAAIGLIFWAHRMANMEFNSEYADVMELALYNAAMAGVSLDGRKFFYMNPLAVAKGVMPNGSVNADAAAVAGYYARSGWFGCSCCPPNVARLMASLGSYIYAFDKKASVLRVDLYIGSETTIDVGGTPVKIAMETDYPNTGKVKIHVKAEKPAHLALALRIPGWADDYKYTVECEKCGAIADFESSYDSGYACFSATWSGDCTLSLDLPMSVKFIEADPRVRQDCGRVALKRGPVVFCLEGRDNGENLSDVRISPKDKFTAKFDKGLLGGTVTLNGKGYRSDLSDWDAEGLLYRDTVTKVVPFKLKAVPYALWNNRGPGEMRIWLLRK